MDPHRRPRTLNPVRQAVVTLLLVLAVSACSSPRETGQSLEFPGDRLTIVVTDSGLGGLSVVADAERKLRESRAYCDVDLVFYNALFTAEGGYNSLPDRDVKISIFDRALQDMQRRYDPDVILVACNTLSVLVPGTTFADTAATTVVGIVEAGVDLIAAAMADDERSRAIIFATQTTAEEGTHTAALTADGIPANRIVVQSCPQLADFIERGYDGMDTEFLIDAYVSEALEQAGPIAGPLLVSFNCTHYGYALEAWDKAFAARGIVVAEYLNPNTRMVDVLLPARLRGRCDSTAVHVTAVSMVEIPAEVRTSLGRYLEDRSSLTAAALRDCAWDPDLFTWHDVIDDEPAARGRAR